MAQTDPIEQWLQYLASNRGLAPATIRRYRRALIRFQAWLGQQAPPLTTLQVDQDTIEHYIGPELHQAGQSPRSRRITVAAIRGYFRYLQRRRHRTDNPAHHIEPPKAGRSLPTVASTRTAEALLMAPDLNTFKGVRDATVLCLLIGCGLRLSGITGLNVSSLLWGHDDKGRERLTIKVKEKGSKERLVPAPPEAKAMLRAYLGHPEREAMDLRLEDGDEPLFVTTHRRDIPPHEYRGEKRRMGPDTVQRMMLIYGRQAGIPDKELHPKALRHLFGTHLADQDVDLRQIQALLGHARIETTTIYTHLAVNKLHQVVDKHSPLRSLKSPAADLVRHLEGRQ